MGQFWCALPFTSVTYYADGAVAPCCKHIGRDTSKNFYHSSPAEALNSPLFVDLQEKFLRGEKPDACKKCWNAESRDIPSYRIMSQEMWEWARPTETVEKKLHMIDVAFGNLCNAACLTCDTLSSHKWLQESEELMQIEGNPFERGIFKTQSNIPEWSVDQLRDLKVVQFDQSEPFLQPGFKKLIRSLKEAGSLQKMFISISTNASYWPDEELLADLWEAKEIEIQVSVDAVGKLFEYLRYPLNWEVVDANTDRWAQWVATKPGTRFIARQTLSVLNLFHEPAVRRWWASKGTTALTYGMVHHPWYLAPMMLPSQYKQQLQENGAHHRVLKTLNLDDTWHESYRTRSEEQRLAVMREFLMGREKKRGVSLKAACPETFAMIFDGELTEASPR